MPNPESVSTATPSAAVITARLALSRILSGEQPGFVAIAGPCAMTQAYRAISREGDVKKAFDDPDRGLRIVDRLPFWKPRTLPTAWSGLESRQGTIRSAYHTVTARARRTANIAGEIGYDYHLARYAAHLTFAWIGSRNITNDAQELVDAVARYDPSLPIGVKNDMTGSIDSALSYIETIRDIRGDHAAPAILIFRGGKLLRTPEAWAEGYDEALERTNGRVIVDAAHGGEMAHDPQQQFKKSVEGQIRCVEHIQAIHSRSGKLALGVMMETTDVTSPTDPVVPLDKGIECILDLAHRKLSTLPAAA